MQQITSGGFTSVQSAWKSRLTKVRISATWTLLNAQYGIGTLQGKHLTLTHADWRQIRTVVLSLTGLDLDAASPKGSRTEVAASAIDEKWSKEKVSHYRIFVTCSQPIHRTFGEPFSAQGAVFWMDYREIDLSRIETIVIVENQEALLHWADFNRPPGLSNALAVYRGHDASEKAVLTLIKSLHERICVVVFPDLDPSGLLIAARTPRANAILTIEDRLPNKRLSHTRRYAAQWHRQSGSGGVIPQGWRQLWDEVSKEQLSISQEAMCAHRLPLTLILRD